MPVQIQFSVEELARLVEHTGMKNIFAARKREQQAAAKRKAAGPQVVLSPRTQQRQNMERARKAGQAEKDRLEEMARKKAAQAQEAKQRSEQMREEQARLAEEAERAKDETEPERRSRPVPRRPEAPPAVAPPAPEVPMPTPEFVVAPTWESVSGVAVGAASTSIEDLKPYVRGNIDTAVLCAPRPDGQIRTWNELLAPPAASPYAADWASWLSPATWVDIPRNRYLGNAQSLEVVTESGNYNEVLSVSAVTPVNDSSAWPPQLRGLGVVVADDTPVVATLPRADYVVRMTRMDPFPGSAGERPSYRSMKLEAVVSEMTLALQAAAQGIGPPIYAAVAWPWERQPGDVGEQKYGMIILMRRADGTMNDWSRAVRRMPQHQPDPTRGPSPVLRRTVEEAANYLVGLCFHIGWTQHINYDIKQGNLLMHEISGQFYVTDFDVMYYRYIPPEAMGVKGCFFVNLLLLAMHVRAYSDSSTVTNSLVAVFAPILISLWDEAIRSPATFGNGASLLKTAKIAPTYDTGSFDHRELARTSVGPRIGRQLAMMVFEYLFDDSGGKMPPPAAVQWAGWNKMQSFYDGYKPLVPQLLQFALLYNRPYPERLREVFGAAQA